MEGSIVALVKVASVVASPSLVVGSVKMVVEFALVVSLKKVVSLVV